MHNLTENNFLLYVVGTQKNCLIETGLLSVQNTCEGCIRKSTQLYTFFLLNWPYDKEKQNWISYSYQLDKSFLFEGVLGGSFHFRSNFKRTFRKQTVEILIRHHILWNLIWFCTVCLCPTKRTLGLYRDKSIYAKWNFILISIGPVSFPF